MRASYSRPGLVREGLNCVKVLVGIAVLLAATVSLAGCSTPPVQATRAGTQLSVVGSGNMVTRGVPVSDFTALAAGSALKVDITRGSSFGVFVTADDNVIDYVESTKSGQTLTLGMKSGSYTNTTVRVAVTMPDLQKISLSGASRATMSGFKPESIEVRLSGASQLTGRLEGRQVEATLVEASKLELGGSAVTLKLSQSGASQAALGDLATGAASVSMKEASSGTVNVKDRLDADLRSASNLYYVGNPSLGSVTSVEASSVKRK